MLKRLLPLALLLAACTTAPSHIGNPLLLPVSALTTGAENAAYNARRARVKDAVIAAGPALLTDADVQETLWQAAPVPPTDRANVLRDIADLPDPGSAQWAEAATVAIMVRL